MTDDVVSGESSALTEEDQRKRKLVSKLIGSENKAIADFAKHLATIDFAAIGVVLTLKEKWLGASPPSWQQAALGLAIVLYLAAALLSSRAALLE